jgi:hypothetical protein
MELRRGLLLFAIVLGLAAIATSLSRPAARRDKTPEPAASEPVPSPGRGTATPLEITFKPSARQPTKRLEAGRPGTVIVEADEAGQAEIEDLGLSATADPLTPARFEVLTSDEESHLVRFRPAGSQEPRTIGTLEIGPPNAGR